MDRNLPVPPFFRGENVKLRGCIVALFYSEVVQCINSLSHLLSRTYFGNASNGTYHLAFPADTALGRCFQWTGWVSLDVDVTPEIFNLLILDRRKQPTRNLGKHNTHTTIILLFLSQSLVGKIALIELHSRNLNIYHPK